MILDEENSYFSDLNIKYTLYEYYNKIIHVVNIYFKLNKSKKNLKSLIANDTNTNVIKNTIEKSREVFNSNYVINNLLLNLTYNFRLMKEKVIYYISQGYIVVFLIQIWIGFICLLYYIASHFYSNRKFLIKFIGHLIWISSIFIILVLCCVMIGVYLLGSFSISLNEGIMQLKNKDTFINQNNTYRCFNAKQNNSYFPDFPYSNKNYIFNEMNNIYNYLLQISFIDNSDFYKNREFLNRIEELFLLINNPENSFINKKEDGSLEFPIVNSNIYFNKILSTKSSNPLQLLLKCSNPITLQIVYDDIHCNVPNSPYREYDLLENRFCYYFNNVTIEEFTSIMERYTLDTTCDTIKNNNEIFHFHKIAINRFNELKNFYEKYEVFYTHIYKTIFTE